MKKIIALIIIAGFALAGCNEDKPTVQAQETHKDINLNGAGQSTAIPTLVMPEKGKYKY